MQFIETMVSILSFSSVVMEGLKPIPAVIRRETGYIQSPVCYMTNT